MKRAWETLGVLAVVATVLFVGCSGGFGPTLPSPDAGVQNDIDSPTNEIDSPTNEIDQPDAEGQICGTVTNSGGDPVQAYVYIGVVNQDGLERVETNRSGAYCLDDVPPGTYAMTVAAGGYATEYRTIEVTGDPQTVNLTLDEEVEDSPTECSVIQAGATGLDEAAGTVHITGSVTNTDADTVVIFQDGDPSLVNLSAVATEVATPDARSFDLLAFLRPGVNTFEVLASNAACTVISDPIEVNWTPPTGSDFFFRVTLLWDSATDLDLHAWPPDLEEHLAYWNMDISAGVLDVDDVDGFGPENFTCNTSEPGRFRIGVEAFSLDDLPEANATVRVVTGGLAGNSVTRTFGPHAFTAESGSAFLEGGASSWRPFDVVLGADGSVSVVAPDNTPLPDDPEGLIEGMAVMQK